MPELIQFSFSGGMILVTGSQEGLVTKLLAERKNYVKISVVNNTTVDELTPSKKHYFVN